jgi:hypothetical protein
VRRYGAVTLCPSFSSNNNLVTSSEGTRLSTGSTIFPLGLFSEGIDVSQINIIYYIHQTPNAPW